MFYIVYILLLFYVCYFLILGEVSMCKSIVLTSIRILKESRQHGVGDEIIEERAVLVSVLRMLL